jgi:hypothetical protein
LKIENWKMENANWVGVQASNARTTTQFPFFIFRFPFSNRRCPPNGEAQLPQSSFLADARGLVRLGALS